MWCEDVGGLEWIRRDLAVQLGTEQHLSSYQTLQWSLLGCPRNLVNGLYITYLYMGFIGVITHLRSIDPNFLDIQVPRFGSPWTRGVPDPVRQCVTSARHLGPHRPPRCHKMVDVSEIQRENQRLGFFFCCKEMGISLPISLADFLDNLSSLICLCSVQFFNSWRHIVFVSLPNNRSYHLFGLSCPRLPNTKGEEVWPDPENIPRWWFQKKIIFTPTWGRFPFWLILFKGVGTTN